MDLYLTWVVSLENSIRDIIEINNKDSLIKFFTLLDYPCVLNNLFVSGNAEKIIYSYGDSEENYSIQEYKYIKNCIRLEKLFNIESEAQGTNIGFYYFEIDCNEEDRDLVACALTKIIHKAFKGLIGFLIRWENNFSFGAKGIEIKNTADDFVISNWWDINNWQDIVPEFLYDNFEMSTNIQTFNEYVEVIKSESDLIKDSVKIERKNNNKDYLYYCHEISMLSTIYKINISQNLKGYYNASQEEKYNNLGYYQIVQLLEFIGSNTISSYELLEQAEYMETEIFEKPVDFHSNKESINDEIDRMIETISDKEFENAEELLKHLK